MEIRSACIATVALLLMAAGPAAATTWVYLDIGEGPYVPGQTVELTGHVWLSCDEHSDGDVLNLTLLNQDDHPWAFPAPKDLTFSLENCQPGGQSIAETVEGEPDPDRYGVYDVQSVTMSFLIGSQAPAFETASLEFGVVDTENSGGSFDIEVEYDPVFTAPSAIGFDMDGSSESATVSVVSSANAESVLRMQVVRFEVDGAAAPAEASAGVTESVTVPSSAVGNPASSTVGFEVDIKVPEEQEDGEDVYRWASAEVAVQSVMEAAQNATQKSPPQLTVVTFTNTDPETQPLPEGESNGTPGFSVVAALSALGVLAALRRRD